VVIWSEETGRKFLRTINSESGRRLSAYVQHLGICGNQPIIQLVLEACTSVLNLALWEVDYNLLDSCLTQGQASSHMLRRLSMSLATSMGSSKDSLYQLFGLPVFSNLTHLEVSDPYHTWLQWLIAPAFHLLPMLTHLALDCPIEPNEAVLHRIPDTISKCRSLRVIVLIDSFVNPRKEVYVVSPPNRGYLDDPRAVILSHTMLHIPHKEWELGCRGGDDFWAKAEQYILQLQEKSA
jgi:hypothetical protein